jgi:hypothetical protein
MSGFASDLAAWALDLDGDSEVYIDDGGLCLRVVGSDAYFEIGGARNLPNATDITDAIFSQLHVPALYDHSGGGHGTIYVGERNADSSISARYGYYHAAIGPFVYSTKEAAEDALYVGKDGEDESVPCTTVEAIIEALRPLVSDLT